VPAPVVSQIRGVRHRRSLQKIDEDKFEQVRLIAVGERVGRLL
jgi:hypothetical protein